MCKRLGSAFNAEMKFDCLESGFNVERWSGSTLGDKKLTGVTFAHVIGLLINGLGSVLYVQKLIKMTLWSLFNGVQI